MFYHRLTLSAPLLPITVCLIVGIAVSGAVPSVLVSPVGLFVAFVSAIVLALLTGRWPRCQHLLTLFCVALLGLLLAALRQERLHQYRFDNKVRQLQAVVISEMSEKAKTVAVDVVLAEDGRKLKCYVQKDERSLRLRPGVGLSLQTVIRPNVDGTTGSFDYGTYLTRQGFTGRCYVPSACWQPANVPLSNLSALDRVRIRFLSWRHQLLVKYRLMGAHDDSYSVLAAMTLGDKTALTKELHEVYAVTGASHVLALSGLHLGILYFVLSLLMLGRRQASTRVVLILAVWSFAFLVGLPVSVVRSALMISLFALFSLGGRGHASINVLCFSAIITLCLNPDALYDIGFQLSYMAVFSILTVLPLMECWVSARWVQRHAVLGRLWSIVAVTLAAQMGVGPLLAFYFGRFSVLFLLTNLFVLPLAWLILTGALVFLLLSGVTWLAQWLATVLLWLVSLMNGGLSWLSRLSIVSVDGLQPTVSQVFICYIMIVSVYVVLLMVSGKRIRLF